jgi:hypothetical protein
VSLFDQDRQQCLDKLIWAMEKLQINLEETQLNKIAELIVQTMTGPWRYFHTPEHIFEVGGEDHPIEVLSALFHDVVYVQVDQSVNFNLSYYIIPFVKEYRGQLLIRDSSELPQDHIFELVLTIFGFSAGQSLSPFNGQNEFLSAVVAAKVFESILPLNLILQIVACIEATIPFRAKNKEGETANDLLYKRLKIANEKYNLAITDQELVTIIQRTVKMANRDVGSFANPSAAKFLDGTWSLLPETNHNLHNPASYTFSEYRIALQKMEGFMNFLKPEVIFQQYKNVPDKTEYKSLLEIADRNLKIGRLYLGCKLLSIGFLEALSLRLGRDIPISSMMGELPTQGFSSDKLEDFIPNIEQGYQTDDEIEKEVLNLLEFGRTKNSNYDLKNSPLTTYMVKLIGFDQMRQQNDRVKAFFDKKISGEEFLAGCNPEITQVVTDGLIMLFDRRKASLNIVKS